MPQSTPWRPQPPSISDPEAGDAPLDYRGDEEEDGGMDTGDAPDTPEAKTPNWLKRAKDAYRFSTTYVDSNYRKAWEDSIRAFNNQHASDSKYNSDVFRKRSNLFRPKTRSVIRKNEAAAAAAFFSNLELLSVDPLNEGIKEERISAEVMQQLMLYRLTKSIPWFQFLMGGMQDGQVQGAACAHIYWDYNEKHDENGITTAKKDTPCVNLFPIENLRIDPSANWVDPINTSPYLIELIPMYWCDVKDRMDRADPKGRRWKTYNAAVAFGRTASSDDSTRQARLNAQQDPNDQKRDVSDYDVVWIHRHIHRFKGEDWEFYTLSSERMLTDPEPLTETVWHGMRPYVLGKVMLETHKAIPSSLPTLTKGLQEEANEVSNQRSDNVKFVLNKGYRVKRGKNVDIGALVRNVPGKIIMCDDVEKDIMEENWPDVTASAYQEQDRIDGDFNDLAGNFSPMQVNTARTPRESTHTMKMLQAPSNLLTEYMLKTFVETFVQPVLRQIMMLEQHYETDSTILAIAGAKAKVFQKYGMNEVTDDLLNKELTLNVNVGMGATDPVMKLQRFTHALMTLSQLSKLPPPGLDLKEITKEVFGLSGYQDGSRFMIEGLDPMVAKLTQQNKQLTMMLQKLGIQVKNKDDANKAKIITNRETNATKLAIERWKLGDKGKDREHSSRHLLAEHLMSLSQGEQQAQWQGDAAEKQHQFALEQQAQKPKPDAA
jgi:hypothetical protein